MPCRNHSTARRKLTAVIVALTLVVSPAANAMLLDYEAYLGNTKVGEARVSIDVGEEGYEISGKAESTGLLGLFGKWKSFFNLRGIFSFGQPVASAYEVTEETAGKKKEIAYEGDKVHVRKNGKARNPMALPADLDLYSLLFLSEDCGDERVVHDGKDVWHLKTRVQKDLTEHRKYCEFDLRDENDERSVAAVWIEQIGALKVPVKVNLEGAMRGTFRLKDHALD